MQRAPAASSSAPIGKSPSTNTSNSSTKQPYFCTEIISAWYSSPRCSSMNWAVFQSRSSRSAVAVRRGVGIERRVLLRMRQRPLERAMYHQIRIAANWRGEMRIFIEAEREMAKRIGRITRLFQRTQHQVRNDALFGLANQLFQQALVVLRRDAQLFRSRQRDFHSTFSPFAIRILAAGSSRC